MREGIDPRDAKKVDEAMKVTLTEVMERYVVARSDKLKESTATEMRRHVEKVFGDWKDEPIVNITEDMCRKRHDKMSREGLRGKPAPGQANISATTLRTLINFAGREFRRADGSPLIQRNPVVNGLSDRWVVMEPRSERYIDPKKVGDVWHMLRSDFWIITVNANSDAPTCYALSLADVKRVASRDKGGQQAFWLEVRGYQCDEFREAWDRIGTSTT